MSEGHDQIERAADRIRDDLLTTLKELDLRRRRATDWRYQLERHSQKLLVAGSIVLAGIPVAIALSATRASRRRSHRAQYRLEGLRRAWEHPDRLARRAPPGFGMQLVRKVAIGVVVGIAAKLAQQALADLLPPRSRETTGYFHE